MAEAKIRDYQRDEIVAVVKTSGIESSDAAFLEVLEETLVEGDSVVILEPGEEVGDYNEVLLSPGDHGYVRAVVDEVPSPFEIDNLDRLSELPEPLIEPKEAEKDANPSLSDELAESAAKAFSEKITSGSAGVGSATYGGARDNTEPHPDEEDEDEEYTEKSEWVGPFRGDRGGTYWQNEEGERRYNPPPESDTSQEEDSGEPEIRDEGEVDEPGPDEEWMMEYGLPVDWRSTFDLGDKLELGVRIASEGERMDVSADELVATDPYVGEGGVEHYMETGEYGDRPIEAVEHEGEYYILDGHHRAAAALASGEDFVPAKVLPESEIDKRVEKPFWKVMEERRQSSLTKGSPLSKRETFATIDDTFMKFYTHVVWYDVEKNADDVNLEKAPEMWRSSDEVPDFVKEYIEQAVADDAFWQGRLDKLPPGAEQHVQDLFEEKMTQPQGWSLGSIIDDLEKMFPGTDKEYLLTLTRNEVAALANKARENAYLESEKDTETYEFYWSGPEDFRTTELCSEAKQRTHPRFGGNPVPIDKLGDILEELARKYPEGKANRLKEWVPHFQCRHTFVRKVYL